MSAASFIAALVVLVSDLGPFRATGRWTATDAQFVPPPPVRVSTEGPSGQPRAGGFRNGSAVIDAGSRTEASERESGLEAVLAAAAEPGQLADSVLADLALGHRDVAVREEAIHALGERGGEVALQTLQQAVHDPRARIRRATVRALIDMGTGEAMWILGGVLTSSDAAQRLDATEALGQVGRPDAATYLEPMLADESAPVRDAAAQWLAELSDERP